MAKTQEIYRLVDAARGAVLAGGIVRAAGWRERLVGLVGRTGLDRGEGLWLVPCNGVHTFGMRFPIDLLVLDSEGRVLRIVSALKPWRVSMPVRGGRSVVELGAGTLAGSPISVGERMTLERV